MIFALVRLVGQEFLPTSPRPFAESALSQSVSFVAAAGGYFIALALAAALIGTARGYYCEPAVPRNLAVALFGGFGMGLLLALVHRRKLHGLLDPAARLVVFWIMPFYGYFQGPLLLAQGLFLGCDGRSWPPLSSQRLEQPSLPALGTWLQSGCMAGNPGFLSRAYRQPDVLRGAERRPFAVSDHAEETEALGRTLRCTGSLGRCQPPVPQTEDAVETVEDLVVVGHAKNRSLAVGRDLPQKVHDDARPRPSQSRDELYP